MIARILDYRLTLQGANQWIAAVPEMTRYVISLPPEVLAKAAKRTRAEQVANLEKDPKAMAVVKQNGLTAKEYIVGVPALRGLFGSQKAAATVRWSSHRPRVSHLRRPTSASLNPNGPP